MHVQRSKAFHRCLKWFRARGVPAKQIIGNLPTQRCNTAKAFSHYGLDYGGPYQIRTTKGRGLFVCFSTRAIHLELVSDLSTFPAALRRFFAQKDYSSDIYNDCATTFLGAPAELKADLGVFQQQLGAAAGYVTSHEGSWHFIPPGSPDFGGSGKRGVKSMQHYLKRVGNATLTFAEFCTVRQCFIRGLYLYWQMTQLIFTRSLLAIFWWVAR